MQPSIFYDNLQKILFICFVLFDLKFKPPSNCLWACSIEPFQLWRMNTLCILRIKAYRGHQWKGKQNNILKKKNGMNCNGVKLLIFIKYQKHLVIEKRRVICNCKTKCYKIGVWNLYTFSVAPSILFENFKKNVLFHYYNNTVSWCFCHCQPSPSWGQYYKTF